MEKLEIRVSAQRVSDAEQILLTACRDGAEAGLRAGLRVSP